MPAAERPSARVLIVDRDLREARLLHAALDGIAEHPTVVRALGLRLKAAGYEVLVATDGIRATQIAIREQPSLILLDIGMPGGDGHTVAQRLKNNLRTVSIPVIFLTARNSTEDARKAKDRASRRISSPRSRVP